MHCKIHLERCCLEMAAPLDLSAIEKNKCGDGQKGLLLSRYKANVRLMSRVCNAASY